MLIFPQNSNIEISRFIKFCEESININSRFLFKVKEGEKVKKWPFPTPITISDAIKYYVDLKGRISKETILELSKYAFNDDEKAKLLELAGSDHKLNELYD